LTLFFDSIIDNGDLFDFRPGSNKFKWLSIKKGILGIYFGQQSSKTKIKEHETIFA